MLRRMPAQSLALRAARSTLRVAVFLLLLLITIAAGCDGGDDTAAKLAAFQRLHTSIVTSPVPPSHVYCGNMKKDTRGSGNCAGKGTDASGQIPAFERTEMRGWIVGGPSWTENDEVGINVLLDWGWGAEAGIRSINTPEKIMETVTPFNVLMYGVDPTNRNGGSRALLPSMSGDTWG